MATAFDDVKPWPSAAAQPPKAVGSVPGHNRPSPAEDAVRDFQDRLAQRPGLLERMVNLLGSVERAVAFDEASAGRCGELVKQIAAVEKLIEDARKEVKEPYLSAGRAVDAAAKAEADPLAEAKAAVGDRLTAFMREAAEPAHIRGDYGALTSPRTVWRHEVIDLRAAFDAVASNERVREAIEKAVGAMVRSGVREIAGVRIFPDTVAQVR